ncbi:fibrinogen-related protein 2 [Plakobranchus ocellatus]|uniref:Fibrinogen-related protein 2 n=1 Tax=Plakobranchus ocellatus TaxID=259542 RepID=A0AAV3YXW7_9GAST|nr:fibrinogen-related protein 2 [Plakobranchus ocellatus]
MHRLQICSYSGTAKDSMAIHNKMFFSTFDRDNDEWSASCAVFLHISWRYKECYPADLHLEWAVSETKNNAWNDCKKTWKFAFTEMKMRRFKLIQMIKTYCPIYAVTQLKRLSSSLLKQTCVNLARQKHGFYFLF